MKHGFRLAILALGALAFSALIGCQPEAQPAASAAAKGGDLVNTPQDKGDHVPSNATTIHDPKDAKDAGGYRIAPENPNDPKYKADPRLGGGG